MHMIRGVVAPHIFPFPVCLAGNGSTWLEMAAPPRRHHAWRTPSPQPLVPTHTIQNRPRPQVSHALLFSSRFTHSAPISAALGVASYLALVTGTFPGSFLHHPALLEAAEKLCHATRLLAQLLALIGGGAAWPGAGGDGVCSAAPLESLLAFGCALACLASVRRRVDVMGVAAYRMLLGKLLRAC